MACRTTFMVSDDVICVMCLALCQANQHSTVDYMLRDIAKLYLMEMKFTNRKFSFFYLSWKKYLQITTEFILLEHLWIQKIIRIIWYFFQYFYLLIFFIYPKELIRKGIEYPFNFRGLFKLYSNYLSSKKRTHGEFNPDKINAFEHI